MLSPFQCPICQQLYGHGKTKPVTLSCGHSCCIYHVRSEHCLYCFSCKQPVVSDVGVFKVSTALLEGSLLYQKLLSTSTSTAVDSKAADEDSQVRIIGSEHTECDSGDMDWEVLTNESECTNTPECEDIFDGDLHSLESNTSDICATDIALIKPYFRESPPIQTDNSWLPEENHITFIDSMDQSYVKCANTGRNSMEHLNSEYCITITVRTKPKLHRLDIACSTPYYSKCSDSAISVITAAPTSTTYDGPCDVMGCGHMCTRTLDVSGKICCSCSDKRPVLENSWGYQHYRDGKGMVVGAHRTENYCPACRIGTPSKTEVLEGVPIRHAQKEVRICGHFCSPVTYVGSTNLCCACADTRPVLKDSHKYLSYRDGRKFEATVSRKAYYCPVCQDSTYQYNDQLENVSVPPATDRLQVRTKVKYQHNRTYVSSRQRHKRRS